MFPLLIPGILAAGKALLGRRQQQQPQVPPMGGTQLGFNPISQLIAPEPNVQMTPGAPPDMMMPAPSQFPMPQGPALKRRGLLHGLQSLGRQNMLQGAGQMMQGNWGTPLGMLLGSALQKTPGGY